ncbi:hypothetical protein [Smaragdicoccus niigatensis]|uniref:hypothetical protein n=1 Tax=Smaragdicoccus niigatensis TaxID=359359 RepID=UPI00037F189D|nr:hypothetical protein [Smaragdicoccus niigatensis]
MNTKRWVPSKSVVMALMAISSGSAGGVSAVLAMQAGNPETEPARPDFSYDLDHRLSA